MYENLLRLPYFQGMSKDDITSILDKVTFEFVKHGDGDIIFRRGERCSKFVILTNGEMQCTSLSPDGRYSITEELGAPYAIEPYSLFGYDTGYKRDYTAKGSCTLLIIDKQYLFSEFAKHNIFTINLLNLISRRTQKLSDAIWKQCPRRLDGRIAHLIAARCESQRGRKQITIKMECLASLLFETRLNVSKSLNEMQERGLLELHRGAITVPSLEKLLENSL